MDNEQDADRLGWGAIAITEQFRGCGKNRVVMIHPTTFTTNKTDYRNQKYDN